MSARSFAYQREQYAGSSRATIPYTARRQRCHEPARTSGGSGTNIRRKREARKWDERYGKLTDLSAFSREILTRIQAVPLSQLVRATGLSLRYVSQIRRGEKAPHPRHWEAIKTAARP